MEKYRRRKHYPLGFVSDNAIYLWLKRDREKAREELADGSDELLQLWIDKCTEMMQELKARHTKAK